MLDGYVCFWPLADIPISSADVRFWAQSGHAILHCQCPLSGVKRTKRLKRGQGSAPERS
jgi:hypothetical protein